MAHLLKIETEYNTIIQSANIDDTCVITRKQYCVAIEFNNSKFLD